MLYYLSIALDELFKHARNEYPNECCGILLGRTNGADKTISLIYCVRNTAAADRRTHFCIDPTEILRAEMYAQQNDLETVGFYHSHPDSDAIASSEDIRYMIPGYSYPIISVKSGQAAEIRCYKKDCNNTVSQETFERKDENADNSLYRCNAANLF